MRKNATLSPNNTKHSHHLPTPCTTAIATNQMDLLSPYCSTCILLSQSSHNHHNHHTINTSNNLICLVHCILHQLYTAYVLSHNGAPTSTPHGIGSSNSCCAEAASQVVATRSDRLQSVVQARFRQTSGCRWNRTCSQPCQPIVLCAVTNGAVLVVGRCEIPVERA
jgi:hypothetical protein